MVSFNGLYTVLTMRERDSISSKREKSWTGSVSSPYIHTLAGLIAFTNNCGSGSPSKVSCVAWRQAKCLSRTVVSPILSGCASVEIPDLTKFNTTALQELIARIDLRYVSTKSQIVESMASQHTALFRSSINR
jgi:hypothetical protein